MEANADSRSWLEMLHDFDDATPRDTAMAALDRAAHDAAHIVGTGKRVPDANDERLRESQGASRHEAVGMMQSPGYGWSRGWPPMTSGRETPGVDDDIQSLIDETQGSSLVGASPFRGFFDTAAAVNWDDVSHSGLRRSIASQGQGRASDGSAPAKKRKIEGSQGTTRTSGGPKKLPLSRSMGSRSSTPPTSRRNSPGPATRSPRSTNGSQKLKSSAKPRSNLRNEVRSDELQEEPRPASPVPSIDELDELALDGWIADEKDVWNTRKTAGKAASGSRSKAAKPVRRSMHDIMLAAQEAFARKQSEPPSKRRQSALALIHSTKRKPTAGPKKAAVEALAKSTKPKQKRSRRSDPTIPPEVSNDESHGQAAEPGVEIATRKRKGRTSKRLLEANGDDPDFRPSRPNKLWEDMKKKGNKKTSRKSLPTSAKTPRTNGEVSQPAKPAKSLPNADLTPGPQGEQTVVKRKRGRPRKHPLPEP